MIPGMEPLHISEGDLARDVRSILQRVEAGGEVIIERDAQPVAVIRPAAIIGYLRKMTGLQAKLDALAAETEPEPATV